MKKVVNIACSQIRYTMTNGVTFSQVDSWYDHTRKDLKMNIIYPESDLERFPCILWICGGAWRNIDIDAHMVYLTNLAQKGFVVASVEHRLSNEAKMPSQVEDIKAAVRYLRAHAARYNIDAGKIGISGESSGGHLALMAAMNRDPALDTGYFLEYSSEVQAVCVFYPIADFREIRYDSEADCAEAPESILCGSNVCLDYPRWLKYCPVSYVSGNVPPILMIHGNRDQEIGFHQSEILYDLLTEQQCDVSLIEVEDADHADLHFFQQEIWDEVSGFYNRVFQA